MIILILEEITLDLQKVVNLFILQLLSYKMHEVHGFDIFSYTKHKSISFG